MQTTTTLPKKGLTADEAFARWGDQETFRELLSLTEQADCGRSAVTGDDLIGVERMQRYYDLTRKIDDGFVQLLRDGKIFASGISQFADRREVIHPSLWDLLEVSFEVDDIVGSGRKYEKPEFFDLNSIPQNIRPTPDWLDEMLGESGQSEFRYERDYRNVHLRGMHFALSPLQAKVVQLLHKAFLEDAAWQVGKQVLERAGTTQTKVVDVFKSREDWQALIDSDGTGRYRLRVGPPYSDKVGDTPT